MGPMPAQEGFSRVLEHDEGKHRESISIQQRGNERMLERFTILKGNEETLRRISVGKRDYELLERDEGMLKRIRRGGYQDTRVTPLARHGEQTRSENGERNGHKVGIMRSVDYENPTVPWETDLQVEHEKKKAHGAKSVQGQRDCRSKKRKQIMNIENCFSSMSSKRVSEAQAVLGQRKQESRSTTRDLSKVRGNARLPEFVSAAKGKKNKFNLQEHRKKFGSHCTQGKEDSTFTSHVQRRQDCSNYRLGDMVWAKVKSHPWWPGRLYDPDLAASGVMDFKRDSAVLVAFFGDSTFGWFAQSELIPFESNFPNKYKQSNEPSFVEAVDDALDEVYKREKSALICHCSRKANNSEKKQHEKQGKLYDRQLKEAREAFEPLKLMTFIKHLACAPFSPPQNMLLTIVAGAQAHAFRVFSFCDQDLGYEDAFGELKNEDFDSLRMGGNLREMVSWKEGCDSGLIKGKKESDRHLKFRKHATSSIVYGTGKIKKKKVRQGAAIVTKISNSKVEHGQPLKLAMMDTKLQLVEAAQSAQSISEGDPASRSAQWPPKSIFKALENQHGATTTMESFSVDVVQQYGAVNSVPHHLVTKVCDKDQRVKRKLKASKQSQTKAAISVLDHHPSLQNIGEVEHQEACAKFPPVEKRKKKSLTKTLQEKDVNISVTRKSELAARVSEIYMSARFSRQPVAHMQDLLETKMNACCEEEYLECVTNEALEISPETNLTSEVSMQFSTVQGNPVGNDAYTTHGKISVSIPATECGNGDMLQGSITMIEKGDAKDIYIASLKGPLNLVASNQTLDEPVGGIAFTSDIDESNRKSASKCINSKELATGSTSGHCTTYQNISETKNQVLNHGKAYKESGRRTRKRTDKVTPSRSQIIEGPAIKDVPQDNVITIRLPDGVTLSSEEHVKKTCENHENTYPRVVKLDVTSYTAQVVYDNAESAKAAVRILKSSSRNKDVRFPLKPSEIESAEQLSEKKGTITLKKPNINMPKEGRVLSPKSDSRLSNGQRMHKKSRKSCATEVDGPSTASEDAAQVAFQLKMGSSKDTETMEKFTTTGTAAIGNSGCTMDDHPSADDVIDISDQFMTLLYQVHGLVRSLGFLGHFLHYANNES